ncbi:hypothetical protein B0H10DRAFT_2097984 [Mycena sp. CBHHK59/15]|nr:hypothetical protein B0H10DRAFT_2097984 [Mycena sp. CBHHK59/15]
MNSLKLSTLLAQDISDPTDFPKASSLQALDSAVRCAICSEYFDGPVSLLCGHCFCSICIRELMSVMGSKSQCPVCRQNANEAHLRPNPAVEEVVAAWKVARPFVLRFAKDEEARAAEPAKKKRRLSPNCVTEPSRPPRAGAKSDPDPDVPPSDALEGDVPKPDAMVDCPVCAATLKYRDINAHIDNKCASFGAAKPTAESSKSQKTMWSDIMRPNSKGKERRAVGDADDFQLPKVSYDTLKDKQLKDKLLEHNLSTAGDRSLLILRHQRWTILHNANLDKSTSKRRTKPELHKELKKWEEERKVKKKKTATTVDEAYVKNHNTEFKRLVAEARPKPVVSASAEVRDVSSSPQKAIPSSASRCPPSSDDDIIVVDSDDSDGS